MLKTVLLTNIPHSMPLLISILVGVENGRFTSVYSLGRFESTRWFSVRKARASETRIRKRWLDITSAGITKLRDNREGMHFRRHERCPGYAGRHERAVVEVGGRAP